MQAIIVIQTVYRYPTSSRAMCVLRPTCNAKTISLSRTIPNIYAGDYASVRARATAMLKEVGLDYFDLLLIHWPGTADADLSQADQESLQRKISFEYFRGHVASAWTNMLRLREEGLCTKVCGGLEQEVVLRGGRWVTVMVQMAVVVGWLVMVRGGDGGWMDVWMVKKICQRGRFGLGRRHVVEVMLKVT